MTHTKASNLEKAITIAIATCLSMRMKKHELAYLDQGARDEQVIGVEFCIGKNGGEKIPRPSMRSPRVRMLPALCRRIRRMLPA